MVKGRRTRKGSSGGARKGSSRKAKPSPKSAPRRAAPIKWIGLTPAQKRAATAKTRALQKQGRSLAYAKRVARAEAKGKSRQEARGHHKKEHVERKAREIREHGITGSQQKSIEKWLGSHHWAVANLEIRAGGGAALIEEAQRRGFAWFQKWRDVMKEGRRRREEGDTRGDNGRAFTRDEWDEIYADLDYPDLDFLLYG